MIAPAFALETRLAEIAMNALAPCDLGDGIEVVHDVETVEIEMDCDLEIELAPDEVLTHQFVRFSAPYERIELQFDTDAFRRATIEEARRLMRSSVPRARVRRR
jgi:hypothetical protein